MDLRILMITPYPPVRDGIAAYAIQEVARLRRQGHDVEVLSPGPSAAHHHLDLRSRRGPFALAKRLSAYDRVIVQFHPDVFYPAPSTTARHVATSAGLALAFRLAADVEVRVHEADYSLPRRSLRALGMRLLWQQVRRLVVHTETERSSFAHTFAIDAGRVELADHGAHFTPRTTLDQTGARRRLALPEEDFIFLSIGFIQPHKGFDRSVRSFARMGASGCRLEVVGSVRVDEPEYLQHLEDLRRLISATPGATLHEGYVSDELFDVWLAASDVVVLPYHHIWSSGVVERAAMFDRPVIATRVGGLESQARSGTVLVDDDDELTSAMRAAAGAHAAASPGDAPWPPEGAARDEVMAAVKTRAAVVRQAETARGGLGSTLTSSPRGSAGASALQRIPLLGLPAPSGRPARRFVKRVVRQLTAWEIDPVVAQVNRLHRATVEVLEDMGSRR